MKLPDKLAERKEMTGLIMKYFVLKPHGEDVYARASRFAMRAYARSIQEVNPELSRELREWADSETKFGDILVEEP